MLNTASPVPASWNDFSYYVLPLTASVVAGFIVWAGTYLTDQTTLLAKLTLLLFLDTVMTEKALRRYFMSNDNVIDARENMPLTFLLFIKWTLGLMLPTFITTLFKDAIEGSPIPSGPVILAILVLVIMMVIGVSRLLGQAFSASIVKKEE